MHQRRMLASLTALLSVLGITNIAKAANESDSQRPVSQSVKWQTPIAPRIAAAATPATLHVAPRTDSSIDRMRPLDPNAHWLIPLAPPVVPGAAAAQSVKNAGRASVQSISGSRDRTIANVPTEARLDTATVKCSNDADVVIRRDHRSIELGDGELLVEARQKIRVKSKGVLVELSKGSVVVVRARNGTLRIDNLFEMRTDTVKAHVGGMQFPLRVGQELLFADNLIALQDSAACDAVQRRCPALFRFPNGSVLLRCEYSPVTVIKTSPLMLSLMHSAVPSDTALFNRLLKMTACLSVATAGHGYFMAVGPGKQTNR